MFHKILYLSPSCIVLQLLYMEISNNILYTQRKKITETMMRNLTIADIRLCASDTEV